MWNKFIFILLAGVLISLHAEADVTPLTKRHFRSISVEKGLSQSTVLCIVQDTLGFMWVGTQDGLNRYNGEVFTVYRPDRNDEHSLQSNYIKNLFVDRSGLLWVGGNKGISRYDYATNNFLNYQLPEKSGNWHISSIVEDKAGKIWASSNNGDIFYFDTGKQEFNRINFNSSLHDINNISKLFFYEDILFLGTDVGLFRMDASKTSISLINLGGDKPFINDILMDDDCIWVGTEGNGIYKYNLKTLESKNYKYLGPGINSLVDNNVRSIKKDNFGNLWIGTFRGLSVLDLKRRVFENYYHHSTVPYTLSQNSVRCIYSDKENGMWLGTFYGGVNYYHNNDIKFSLLNQNTGALSLNDQVVNVIKQDANKDIWIGTNDKGLNYWNQKAGTIEYYTHDEYNSNSLSSNNIKSIAFDKNGNVLLGTHNTGLNYLNRKTQKITSYKHSLTDPKSIAGNMVYALLNDHKNRIWVGTRTGLDRFNEVDGTFTHIYVDKTGKRLSSDEVTFLLEDSKNRIWVGTGNGVNILFPETNLFEPFQGSMLSNDVVNCIAEDNKNRIWVGTKDGLNLFDENTRTFLSFNNHKDLNRGTINGIVADDDGFLWISTNSGLLKFDPESYGVQLFDHDDGLQNNQLNLNAFAKTADGMILFGGINGISYFYPQAIKQTLFDLKVTFTRLEVFNKDVVPSDAFGILDNHIDQSNQLRFTHDLKQFTIFFNTFNYISPNKIKYYYQLEGYDEEWQISEKTPRATYANLKPGNYTFYVKAEGPLGETSPVRSLKIKILPPWWGSSWFYLLIGLLSISGIFMAYKFLSERIRTKQQLKMERLEREKVDYVSQMKMEFFTNVSHEFRTPLTLIIAPLEEALSKPNLEKEFKKLLTLMLVNSKRLYNLVDQLFEFRKTELGIKKLQVSKGDIVSFVHDIYASFLTLSEKNNIDYTFRSTESRLVFYFDKDSIEKICFNLLSNAFKYTHKGGKIEITLSKRQDNLFIIVSDTGIGIDTKYQELIFERFYQVNNQQMNLGSGVGLSFTKRLVELHHGHIEMESTVGVGTTFAVSIPIDESKYSPEEYVHEDDFSFTINNAFETVEILDDDIEEEQEILVEKESLLIVDDNHEIVDYLKNYFSETYEISVAYDGEEALALLDEEDFSLIVCDVMMPKMDGIQFCKRVKQNVKTSHIPIVLLTAKTESYHQIKGLEVGADDYVTKPFSITVLEAKLQNIIRSRKRLKEYYSNSTEIIPENIAFNKLDEEFLYEVIKIIEANLSDSQFSVDTFSKEIGMSRSNLYLKLKAITGQSATDFIKRIRFKKAVELMETREYTIAQIAYMVGFNSPSYFSTSFKQYYDCLPTEYLAKRESK